MSDASSEHHVAHKPKKAGWNPWLGVGLIVFLFFFAQVVASAVVSLYPILANWTTAQADAWLKNSLNAKLLYLTIYPMVVFAGLYFFLKAHGANFKSIGLNRFKPKYIGYSLAIFPIYFLVLLGVAILAKALFPSLNLNQTQDLGLNGTYVSFSDLAKIFYMLVILPPITEEIMFRGMLFTSFKKAMSVIYAALATSLLFAVGHLPEGGSGGPLYVAAIDTFVLSLFLVYLRVKTNSLWASIGLHAIKNTIAFLSVFVLPVR